MPSFRIIEQKVAWGWKDNKDIDSPKVKIVEYDSLRDLLVGEEFYDDDYDEDNQDEYDRMLAHLAKNSTMYCSVTYKTFRPNPEPCDSYLTFFNEFTITELSNDDLAKMDAERTLRLLLKKAENKFRWDAFFKEHNGSNGEILDTLYNDYEFPSEIK